MPMKHLSDILPLGHELLYTPSEEIKKEELSQVTEWVNDLNNVMNEIRAKYQFGRGIAAPQLGIMKRLIYINIDRPIIVINPVIEYLSDEKFELWDDCMCFPNLYVRVERHKEIIIKYLDENWNSQIWQAKDEEAELIQHEYDHLEGILCTMRAIDGKSFKWRNNI